MLNIELGPIVYKVLGTLEIPQGGYDFRKNLQYLIIKVEQELAQQRVILKRPYFYEKDDCIDAIEAGNAVSHNGYAKYLSKHSFMASQFAIRKCIYALRKII